MWLPATETGSVHPHPIWLSWQVLQQPKPPAETKILAPLANHRCFCGLSGLLLPLLLVFFCHVRAKLSILPHNPTAVRELQI